MNFLNKKGTKSLIVLVVALIVALFVEFNFFVYDSIFKVSGNKASLLDGTTCKTIVSGYEIDSFGTYFPVNSDPQIIFTDIQAETDSILITFADKILTPTDYQFFYSSDGDFIEENSFTQTIPIGAESLLLTLPDGDFDDLRLDINGNFIFKDIVVTDGEIILEKVAVQNFSFLRLTVLFLIISCIALCFTYRILSKNPRKLSLCELLFVFGVFCFYFLWAIAKRYNYAPDEAMRYDVTRFLFENNRLPVYDELLSEWGFSYAHLPTVLCNQLGYVLMKIASVFTSSPQKLLFVARMVSVLSCTGAVYFIIKLTKIIFKSPARWIMIVTVAFMPQFAFIASYVNNDSVAFLGIAIIAYSWALGLTDNWNIKNCLLLSTGLSICALSYYNSYAWILLSIFFFIFSYLYKNKKDYKGLLKHVGIVAGLTFLLAGHSFIRHLVIYKDLLGFETLNYYGDLYSVPALHPNNRLSISEQGFSLHHMLFDMDWLLISFRSFIGVFGYMEYPLSEKIYSLARIFILIAIIGCAINLAIRIFKKQKPDTLKLVFCISAILCAVITIGLSIYNSYNADFQPQGRYCYPAFLTIALFIGLGYDGILKLFKDEKYRYVLTAIISTAFIGISLYTYLHVYLPS